METKQKLHKRKGVAGLDIFLSIIAMLFMIGIIIMVFVIAGVKMSEQVPTESLAGSLTNDVTNLSGTYRTLTGVHGFESCVASVTNVAQVNGTIVLADNYTVSGCSVIATATIRADLNNTDLVWNATYTYEDANALAQKTINDTYVSLSGATDWFPTFIVLGAMVVLILLVVIIINSIRQSGITGEGGGEKGLGGA